MSAPADQASRRRRLLADVLTATAASGVPTIPVAAVTAAFGGVDAFLLAAQHRWSTALMAHLDAVLEDAPEDVERAVTDVWHATSAKHPGLRALLDANADNPALAAAGAREHELVSRDLGVDLGTIASTSEFSPREGHEQRSRCVLRPMRRRLFAW